MIREFLSDIFDPNLSFGDRCLATLIVTLVVLLVPAVIGLLGLLGYMLADFAGIAPAKTAVTVVEEKKVVPAQTTVILMKNGMFPQCSPESYRLHFKIDGKELTFTVKREFFNSINVGDKIEVGYGFGRLTGSLQPIRIKLADK